MAELVAESHARGITRKHLLHSSEETSHWPDNREIKRTKSLPRRLLPKYLML
jgi:hypothetical protein